VVYTLSLRGTLFHCRQASQTATCGSLACVAPDFLFLHPPALRNVSKYSYAAKQVEEFSFSECPAFGWDRVNFLPSSCCILDLV